MTKTTGKQKREALGASLIGYNNWMTHAQKKGWKLPGNSPLPNEVWVDYWKAMDLHERGVGGRPVVPHRSGGGK